MKRVVAELTGTPAWSTLRPPLVTLDNATAQAVLSALRDAGFKMPRYPRQ